jgi:hypothetical protein
MQSLLETASNAQLERDTDGESDSRIAPVVQVIATVHIDDIDIVVVVPVIAPVRRIWVQHRQPVTAVLETRIPADHQEGETLNTEAVVLSEIAAKVGVRNAIAVIASALLPAPVVPLPVVGAVLLPRCLPVLPGLVRPLLRNGALVLLPIRPLLRNGALVLLPIRPLLRDGTLVLLLVRPLLRDGTLILLPIRPLLLPGRLLCPGRLPPGLSRGLLLLPLLLGPGLLAGVLLLWVIPILSRVVLSSKGGQDESQQQHREGCGGYS